MSEPLKVISTPEQKKQITVGNNMPKIVWAFDVQRPLALGAAGKLSVELLLDPGVPAPGEGSTIQGDLEQTAYGWRLRLPRPGGGGGGRGRSPQETKAIQRQHSQEMALRLIDLAIAHKIMPVPADSSELFRDVAKTTDWFEKDIAS